MKSSISRQAISTRRCPAVGSKPVVSVSRTISRAMTCNDLLRPPSSTGRTVAGRPSLWIAHHRDDFGHLSARRLQAAGGVDDEVRPGAFFGVSHLLGQDGVQPL